MNNTGANQRWTHKFVKSSRWEMVWCDVMIWAIHSQSQAVQQHFAACRKNTISQEYDQETIEHFLSPDPLKIALLVLSTLP